MVGRIRIWISYGVSLHPHLGGAGMKRPPSATRTASIRAARPLKMSAKAPGGCYVWDEFFDDFTDYWPAYMDGEPTEQQWRTARNDWRRGNTGWEAVQNARNRAAEASAKAAQPKLVHLGGRHYAYEGSAFHQKHLALIDKDSE